MKTRKGFRCFLALMLFCVFTDEINGEAKAADNLGLTRWETFEETLKHYRSLLNSGADRDEDTRRAIDEYIKADSKAQIESLKRFYSGRLMLFVTRTTKDNPGLPESELAGLVASRITQLESTLQGFNADLPDNSKLIDRVKVLIQSAGEMKKVFQSWRTGEGLTNSSEESKKENKPDMATPNLPPE